VFSLVGEEKGCRDTEKARTNGEKRGAGIQCGGETALLGTRCLKLSAQTLNLLLA
jgi:hypothetical protein